MSVLEKIKDLKLPESIVDLFDQNLEVKSLGEPIAESPLKFFENIEKDSQFFTDPDERIMSVINQKTVSSLQELKIDVPSFEKAGPRHRLFFRPGETVSGIVTAGGLCPGLNSVIRDIVFMNHYRYNNQRTYGFRYGFEGLVKDYGHEVMLLTPDEVENINNSGGTILGTSRGPQDPEKMVDRLEELKINVLYTIGGDGTQRAAQTIVKEIERRGLKISVIGIPKTIDNDINYLDKSFGAETAFSEATTSIFSAHTEAKAAYNGIGIVKVMGRESGFIAANACLATNEANYCLIPEDDFDLEGEGSFLEHLEKRILHRHHALIVVAEGVGQKFFQESQKTDKSGNRRLNDIGLFLKEKIGAYLKRKKISHTIKYIDPSYTIRSCPPNANDSIYCTSLAQMAVHAGMAGKTGMVVGYLNRKFIHVPMHLTTFKRKRIDLTSTLWMSVLETTGQPAKLKNLHKS